MALPQDGVNANALAKVTTIPTGKELIFIDPTTNEGGVITLEDLTKQILQNLTSQTFTLDQGTKTLPAALNELNSNGQFVKFASAEKVDVIKEYLTTNKPNVVTIFKIPAYAFAIATPYNPYNNGYCGFLYFNYFTSDSSEIKCYSYRDGEWFTK